MYKPVANKILVYIFILAIMAMCPSLGFANTTDGMVGWWSLGDQVGMTVQDNSGAGNDGSLVNSSDRDENRNRPLRFNGRDQYVSIPDSSSLQPRQVTVSAWVNPRSLSSSMAVVSKAFKDAPWTFPYLSWLIRINTPSLIEMDVGNGSTYSAYSFSIDPLSVHHWCHLAFTYDGTTLKAYVNGQNMGTNTVVQGDIAYASGPVLIGAEGSAVPAGEYFSGMIDDVRIFNRALSDEEINELYQSPMITLVFKSGQIMEGELLKQTDQFVSINYHGAPLTFLNDEIAHMDKKL